MTRVQRRNLISILAAIVVGFALVFTSYYIGNIDNAIKIKRDHAPQEETAKSNRQQTEDAKKLFLNNRSETTLLNYLNYLDAIGQTPHVMALPSTDIQNTLLTAALDSLKTDAKALETNVEQVDAPLVSDLLTGDIATKIKEQKPHALIIPINSWREFGSGVLASDLATSMRQLYSRIRIASPDTLIIFTLTPIFSEDASSLAYVNELEAILRDAPFNIYDWQKSFSEARTANSKAIADYYDLDNNTLTPDGEKDVSELLVKAMKETKIDARHSYQGETDDLAELESESLSREASITESESIEAARQAELQAQEASRQAEQNINHNNTNNNNNNNNWIQPTPSVDTVQPSQPTNENGGPTGQ